MENEMDFADFKNGPARGIFAGLGDDWSEMFRQSASFEDLRNSVVERNDRRYRAAIAAGVMETP